MEFQYLSGAVNADGLSQADSLLLQKLINIYNDKLAKNQLQKLYYYNKTKAKNLGLAAPEKVEDLLSTSIGWAAKSVDTLAKRSLYDGYVVEGDSQKLLDRISEENRLNVAYQMAITPELIHSCGFWTVVAGENDIPIIRYFNAEQGAAMWDYSHRRILAGFVIKDYNYNSVNKLEPSHIELHTIDRIVEIKRDIKFNYWIASSHNHILGRPCMEVMAYRPTDLRPFGKSRITRTVMDITDEMQRECMRTAISCELFSAPFRYINGVEDESFAAQPDLAYWTKMFIATRDDEGNIPEIGQLPTASMEPHIAVMRNLATRMSAESGIPVNEFGVLHDQPASAEALKALMESLCIEAESLNETNGYCLKRVLQMSLAISQNKAFKDLTDEELGLKICFRNPFTPSLASTTDAMMKQASISPWLPYTTMYWKGLGYNEAQRAIIFRERKRAEAEMDIRNSTQRLAEVELGQRAQQQEETETIKDGDTVTTRAELVQEQSE